MATTKVSIHESDETNEVGITDNALNVHLANTGESDGDKRVVSIGKHTVMTNAVPNGALREESQSITCNDGSQHAVIDSSVQSGKRFHICGITIAPTSLSDFPSKMIGKLTLHQGASSSPTGNPTRWWVNIANTSDAFGSNNIVFDTPLLIDAASAARYFTLRFRQDTGSNVEYYFRIWGWEETV